MLAKIIVIGLCAIVGGYLMLWIVCAVLIAAAYVAGAVRQWKKRK